MSQRCSRGRNERILLRSSPSQNLPNRLLWHVFIFYEAKPAHPPPCSPSAVCSISSSTCAQNGKRITSNSHRFVVSAGLGRAVVFWNSYTMHVLARRDGHGATVRHCLVDDRSDRVITISADKAVRCWDSATFRCIQVCVRRYWRRDV